MTRQEHPPKRKTPWNSMYSVVKKNTSTNHKSYIKHQNIMKRGIRNNNPLNIRHSADRWQGARKEQTDQSFVQFESMAYGYRAAWKTLDTYYKRLKERKKHFTVENIIARWAPPTENDTRAYIRQVLRLSGIGGKENLLPPSNGGLPSIPTTLRCVFLQSFISFRPRTRISLPGSKLTAYWKRLLFSAITSITLLIMLCSKKALPARSFWMRTAIWKQFPPKWLSMATT